MGALGWMDAQGVAVRVGLVLLALLRQGWFRPYMSMLTIVIDTG